MRVDSGSVDRREIPSGKAGIHDPLRVDEKRRPSGRNDSKVKMPG
jgi:hypothetical protein